MRHIRFDGVDSGFGFKHGCYNLVEYLVTCDIEPGNGIPDCECTNDPNNLDPLKAYYVGPEDTIEDNGVPDGNCYIPPPDPEPVEQEVKIEWSKTQTCAINETMEKWACDPKDTTPDNPEPDTFQALSDEANSGDPHGVPTQLARPGDRILFGHYYDKAAQKLAAETTWVSLPGFSATKCKTDNAHYIGANMPNTSSDCRPLNNTIGSFKASDGDSSTSEKMEETIPHSHANADDLAGTGGAGGYKVLDVADSCYYNYDGKGSSTPDWKNISIANLSELTTFGGNPPALDTLSTVAPCSNNNGTLDMAYLESTVSAKTNPVKRTDVGSKAIYQKTTLYDRVAEMLKNQKQGEGVVEYPSTGQKEVSSMVTAGTGEDNQHVMKVEWRNQRSYTNNAPAYDCDCCGSCTGTCQGGDCNGGCGCGAYKEGTWDGKGSYIEYEHTWVKMVNDGPVSSNAQFNIPYNYKLTPFIDTQYFPPYRMIPGGTEIDYSTWVSVDAVKNEEFSKAPQNYTESYATITRPETTWKVTEFYISENQITDPNPGTVYDMHDKSYNPCSTYVHASSGIQNVNVADYCKIVAQSTGPLNDDDDRFAKSQDAYTPLTAVIADVPAGTKFCVGLSVMDYASYDFNNEFGGGDDEQTYGDPVHNWWMHLKPECISVSKIPTMQVWGGGLYSESNVLGKYAIKKAALTGSWKAFGSWSEYDAIGSILYSADATIKLFGSAAALGRGLDLVSNISNVGSGGSISNGCAFTKLHIANTTNFISDALCHTPESAKTGSSSAFKGLAQRVALRYTNRVKVPSDKVGRWVTGSTTKIDDINTIGEEAQKGSDYDDWDANSKVEPKSGEITYYRASGNATIKSTNVGKGKTVIVEVNGTARIDGNITYTDALLESIYEIPQVIIFADNVDIAPSVTQVDAWLMVGLNGGSGIINTCANGIVAFEGDDNSLIASNGGDVFGDSSVVGKGNGSLSEHCRTRLKINGPVQAKKLKLLRSYGAGMGLQCNYDYKDKNTINGTTYTSNDQAQWPNGGRTSNCGSKWYGTGEFSYDSATPAEVFNLRADAYLWAYKQVENYSQAFVTYSREVAPRY
ncbi:MAG: hypothetical protein LBQ02_01320 [Candidatus Nomurabacteria bacterium]|nr:hypothetical protein [Candidatus Nomurabacteria bacterium]